MQILPYIGSLIIIAGGMVLLITVMTREPSTHFCSRCNHWHRGEQRQAEPFSDHSGAVKAYAVCGECEAREKASRA